MNMPQVTEHHRKLAQLAGEWEGTEKIHVSPMSPQERSTTGHTSSRMDFGGFFLVSDYVQKCNGQVCFRGHGVYGWDPRKEKYTMHWFDVMGGDPGAPGLGAWDGNKLAFVHEHPMGFGRYSYIMENEKTYKFVIELSQDGMNWMTFMDGTYRRV
jgi:hypothetical protein